MHLKLLEGAQRRGLNHCISQLTDIVDSLSVIVQAWDSQGEIIEQFLMQPVAGSFGPLIQRQLSFCSSRHVTIIHMLLPGFQPLSVRKGFNFETGLASFAFSVALARRKSPRLFAELFEGLREPRTASCLAAFFSGCGQFLRRDGLARLCSESLSQGARFSDCSSYPFLCHDLVSILQFTSCSPAES
jgi:hypothetical protein